MSPIVDLPKYRIASQIQGSKGVYISNCPMDRNQINPAIGSLTKLTELMLVYMNLQSLPENIGNLTNLQELYAYSNQLDSLPDSFENLTNLTKLDLIIINLTIHFQIIQVV